MTRYLGSVAILVLCACAVVVYPARAQWMKDGIPICSAESGRWGATLVSDGLGGAIIAWRDARIYSSPSHTQIYIQRVTANGSISWTLNGIALYEPSLQGTPQMISDDAGGAIVAWTDYRELKSDIYAQRIDGSGSAMWTAGGVAVCAADHSQYYIGLVPDGLGGAIMTWQDTRWGSWDVYTQRIDASGSPKWTSDGIPIFTHTLCPSHPQLVSDGSGAAIIIWQQPTGTNFDIGIYAQKVDATGSVEWAPGGIIIATITTDGSFPVMPSGIAPDGSGGAIVVWPDYRNGNWDIYAQRVDAGGSMLWTADGIAVSSASGTQEEPRIIADNSGGGIVAWQDFRSGACDLYAQKIDLSGAAQWTVDGAAICSADGNRKLSGLESDGSGGAILAWVDERNGSMDVFAQCVNAVGSVMWMVDGVPVCTASGQQYEDALTSDGQGGAVIAWTDERNLNSVPGGILEIYAQKITAAGEPAAVLLQSSSASFSDAGIAISWTLSEVDSRAEFFIERAEDPSGPFVELSSSEIAVNGLSFVFTDTAYKPSLSYWYRVGYWIEGERTVLFETDPIVTPAMSLSLFPNYPNPFNPSTTISFYLPSKSHVTLELFDISSRLVARLLNAEISEGLHSIQWKGVNESGRRVASGIYFCRLRVGKEVRLRKIVLMQ
jgi:hypothetical protein